MIPRGSVVMTMGREKGKGAEVPERFKVLDGSVLKLLAVLTMIVDHTASALLWEDETVLVRIGEYTLDRYSVMRLIGRISFPLFAFLLVEGFLHTRNLKRYALNLLLAALLSEIPWNLEHSGSLLYRNQNVLFTLFFGLMGIWVIRDFSRDAGKECALLLGLTVLVILFRADYGLSGFGFILMLYLLRERKLYQAVLGCCILSSHWVAGLAFIPISLYNGKRGFIRSRTLKYAFYLIYPVHLLILYWIRRRTVGY